MKRNLLTGLLLVLGMSTTVFASSDDLARMDESVSPNQAAAITGNDISQLPAQPLIHDTNYGPEFNTYASFMQSPYNSGAPAAGTAMQQGPDKASMPQDPYNANELNPFSKYSPYLEIQGEGSNYTLGIDDVLTIIVRDQPDFSGRYIIDPEGNIQYNFVGNVKAEGLTKEQLKEVLVERLKKFVRYPEVAVMISQYRSKAVYVFGYVNAPGKYAMKGDKITVKDAVVAAGLPRFDGALKRVYVIRPEKLPPKDINEEGPQIQEKIDKRKVDLKKMLYKGESADNFVLKPGDTIVINQRYFDKFVNNFSRIVGPLFQAAAVYELGFGNQDGFLKGGDK